MTAKERTGLGSISLAILDLLKTHPKGLNIEEIRALLPDIGTGQQHLDRRLRDLDPFHIIDRNRKGRFTVYTWIRERPDGEWGYEVISKTLRAKVLNAAHGRCQMCGKTIASDAITLHVDHKIPQEWGGSSDFENLWAICSVCNEGKKNHFAELPTDIMQKVLKYESVHERIFRLLEIFNGEPVDGDLISFVASAVTPQDDWKKRTRELRYFGAEIEITFEYQNKRKKSLYALKNQIELPDNPTKAAREYETQRAKRNKDEEML